MKLKEKHIIKAGGVYCTDKFNVKWIDLNIGEESRSRLRFYNYGAGFNVYVVSNEESRTTIGTYTDCVQFTTIKWWLKFQLLLFVFN
jgi:hypothetical protein